MNGTKVDLKLSDFDISESTGFIPCDPSLERLPGDCFDSWERLAVNLPTLLKERRLREEVHRLPLTEFNEKTLGPEAEWRRAYVVLSFLSQAYIWMDGEAGLPDRIPKILAVPWCEVSHHLGMPPVITYAATAAFNYELRDPKGPMDVDNLHARITFSGTEDESWFYVVPLFVEMVAVPALKAMLHTCSAILNKDNKALNDDLLVITESLVNMRSALKRMYDHCKPEVFFTEIRPFQAGSKGLDAFPEGIIYEGVDPKPRKYHGASAGQSAAIHVFDVFFATKHNGSDDDFLRTMRKHMPPKHSAFLETLAQQPAVREYARQSHDIELIQSFNVAVNAFADFRSEHIILVARYIVMQRPLSKNASLNMKGTGGTDFMQFLKKVRNDTAALEISLS